MELSFLYSLQALHNPALDKVMIFFTNLGEYGSSLDFDRHTSAVFSKV